MSRAGLFIRVHTTKMKKPARFFLCVLFLCLFTFPLNAQAQDDSDFSENSRVSPFMVFHNLGWNILHTAAYNYGLNFAAAGFGTWVMVETGLDWNWRNVVYDNRTWLPYTGLPLLFAGYIVPFVTPVAVYLSGLRAENTKLQITGVALLQALAITQAFHVSLKLVTGRSTPGLISGVVFEPGNQINHSKDDFSDEFQWWTKGEIMDGWPSGHTASAFSAAGVISEIYSDRPWLKFCAYSYAFLMGFSVAVNTHWASDVLAGALIGYAAGKTVGRSFNRLLGKNEDSNRVSLLITANTIGVRFLM